MPKFPALKLIRGPIAARTRSKLGSPMFIRKLTQYPLHWLSRNRARARFPRYLPSEIKEVTRSISRSTTSMKERSESNDGAGENGSEKAAERRTAMCSRGDDYFKLATSQRDRKKKSKSVKRIEKSLAMHAIFKPCWRRNGQIVVLKGGVKNKSKGKQRAIRVNVASSRAVSNRQKRMGVRSRSKCKNSRRRKCTPRSGSRSMARRKKARGRKRRQVRRRASKKFSARKTERQQKRRRRRRRRRRDWDDDDSPKRLKNSDVRPTIVKEQEHMMEEPGVSFNKTENEHDEYRENPLDISTLCRSLVKSMHGMPADIRDESPNRKNVKPEMQRCARRRRSLKKRKRNTGSKPKARRGKKDRDKPCIRRRRKALLNEAIRKGQRGIGRMIKKVRDTSRNGKNYCHRKKQQQRNSRRCRQKSTYPKQRKCRNKHH